MQTIPNFSCFDSSSTAPARHSRHIQIKYKIKQASTRFAKTTRREQTPKWANYEYEQTKTHSNHKFQFNSSQKSAVDENQQINKQCYLAEAHSNTRIYWIRKFYGPFPRCAYIFDKIFTFGLCVLQCFLLIKIPGSQWKGLHNFRPCIKLWTWIFVCVSVSRIILQVSN